MKATIEDITAHLRHMVDHDGVRPMWIVFHSNLEANEFMAENDLAWLFLDSMYHGEGVCIGGYTIRIMFESDHVPSGDAVFY